MTSPLIILILTQLVFTASDVLGRHFMHKYGFTINSFLHGWFIIYVLLHSLATLGQLYVFTTIQLGKTITLFAIVSIVFANIIGLLLLRESISITTYIGIALATSAFLILSIN